MMGRRSGRAGVLPGVSPLSSVRTLLSRGHVLDELDEGAHEALLLALLTSTTDVVAAAGRTVDLVDDHACGPVRVDAGPGVDGVLNARGDRRGVAVVAGVDLKGAVARMLGNDVRERRLAVSRRAGEEEDLRELVARSGLLTRSRGRPRASW